MIGNVDSVRFEDATADGVIDLVIAGIDPDETSGQRYRFTLRAEDGELREVARIQLGSAAAQGAIRRC